MSRHRWAKQKIKLDYSKLANVTAVIARDKLGNLLTLDEEGSVSVGKPNDSREVLTTSLLSTLSQGNSTGQPSLSPSWNRSLTDVGSNSTGQAIADANSSQTGLALGLGAVLLVLVMAAYAWCKHAKGSRYQLYHHQEEEELRVTYLPGAEISTDETVSIGGISNNDEHYLGSSSAVNATGNKEKKCRIIIETTTGQ